MFNAALFNGIPIRTYDCPSSEEIAERVWSFLLSDHNTPDSFGSLVKQIADDVDNGEILV